jgi:hypothetical protein
MKSSLSRSAPSRLGRHILRRLFDTAHRSPRPHLPLPRRTPPAGPHRWQQ